MVQPTAAVDVGEFRTTAAAHLVHFVRWVYMRAGLSRLLCYIPHRDTVASMVDVFVFYKAKNLRVPDKLCKVRPLVPQHKVPRAFFTFL